MGGNVVSEYVAMVIVSMLVEMGPEVLCTLIGQSFQFLVGATHDSLSACMGYVALGEHIKCVQDTCNNEETSEEADN